MDAKCIFALIQTDGTDDIKITKRMRWELDQSQEQSWAIYQEEDCVLREELLDGAYLIIRRWCSVATQADLDTFLDEIGLGVKAQSKAEVIKQQEIVAGDPRRAEPGAFASSTAFVPSLRIASQISSGRGIGQRGRGRGIFQRKSAPGDVRVLVKLDDERRYPPQKPIILFDLNGTLTSHTSQRRSAGINKMRPGMNHLRRLLNYFKLGINSSATDLTVKAVLPMLEGAAGDGAQLFQNPELILHRGHTQTAPQDHIVSGGKDWDTVKPLARCFGRMHQVLLVDDDEYKARPQERQNMILIPCWEEQQTDSRLEQLVNAILRTLDGINSQTDVRQYTAAISAALAPVQQGVVNTV